MAIVLQRKFLDDEPCIYFDEESWYDSDRSEVRRNRGGLWQRGGCESYMADDEWETLERSESQRLEAEYQRLVKAGEVEDIDLLRERLRWIPVSEELPVDIPHGYCLVTDGKEVGTANYDKTANKFDHCIDRDYWTPTHWMPLPEPPEVK